MLLGLYNQGDPYAGRLTGAMLGMDQPTYHGQSSDFGMTPGYDDAGGPWGKSGGGGAQFGQSTGYRARRPFRPLAQGPYFGTSITN